MQKLKKKQNKNLNSIFEQRKKMKMKIWKKEEEKIYKIKLKSKREWDKWKFIDNNWAKWGINFGFIFFNM